jgi:hypothetical protein
MGLGFRVQGLGFRVKGLRFRVVGLRSRAWGLGLGVGFRFRRSARGILDSEN